MAGKRGKGKRRDILDYRRDDFELLELQALREMFQIQFRKFGDSSERLLKVKYDVNRIIDDVRTSIVLKNEGCKEMMMVLHSICSFFVSIPFLCGSCSLCLCA